MPPPAIPPDAPPDGPVLVHDDNSTCCLTLNRPDRGNALCPEMVQALGTALDAAVARGMRLIVFRGAGDRFCTGFDLSGLESLSDSDLLLRFVRIELLLQRIHTAPCTTLAVAHGGAHGAGADLFVACDRRLAHPSARFSFPGSAFGLVLGTARLAARIGESAARAMILNDRMVTGADAVTLGLATALVEDAALPMVLRAADYPASRLDPATVAALHGASRPLPDGGDAALAALVRSASRPGLRDRIAAYRASMRRGS